MFILLVGKPNGIDEFRFGRSDIRAEKKKKN